MLQILRKKAQSTFIQIIVVIIALVFIFWGVGTNMSGNRQAALVINDDEVTFQEFQQAYDRAYQRLSDQFGGNVPKGLAETFGIKQQVINQLIQGTLLRQGAEEMGLKVSGQEIRQIIEEMVQFQQNGVFSMEQYKNVLAANRMAPTKFEASMRIDRLSEVAAREISNFGAIPTDFEIEELYSQTNEKIGLRFIKISPDHFTDKVVIEDTSLKQWFETVKDNYKTEPEVKLRYLPFTYEAVGNKIEIDGAKVEEYYRENLSDFQTPEQRHARHILLKAGEEDSASVHEAQKKKAEEVLELALGGEDFAALAREHSEGPSKDSGGDLGFFGKGNMVPAFEDAVFALQKGDVSEVVKTRFGYHIIFLEEIQPASTKPLEEVSSEIIKTLQRKEAEALAFQVANSAYEGIISAGSLTQYGQDNPDAQILETDFFPKTNGPAELQQDTEFLNQAFALNKGELSSLIKGQSGYAILFAEDFKEPELPQFETIRNNLETDYKEAKSIEMAEAAAKALLASLREGKEIVPLATEQELTVIDSGLLSRAGQNGEETFPASLLENAFKLSSAAPYPEEPGRVANDFYVYAFREREIPALPEDSKEVEQYRQNLLQFKQQQLLSAWLRHMEAGAEITQHQSL
ncbi:MAG: SurA N-terminal domain-containing protein [Desulforhopalus sp.]